MRTSRAAAMRGANKPRRPYISGLFYVPTRLLEGRVNVSALKKELTVKHFDSQTGETTDVLLYSNRVPGFIGLPRAWGRKHLRDIWDSAQDQRVHPRRDASRYPKTVGPRDDKQAAFMAAIRGVFSGSDNVTQPDVQVCAATGSGKTVSLSVGAATSGIFPLCVVVHTNRLKEQWLGSVEQKKGLRFLFGEEWVKKNVGIVQQDVCDYEGKLIVIAMAPSLVSRRYDEGLYEYFGAVGVDEVHKMATPTFNQVMGMFPAYYHVGLTATPKEGPMGKCITAHIGKPAITSDQKVMQPKVFRVKHQPKNATNIIKYSTGEIDDSSQSIITPLSRMRTRNELLADIIYWRGYVRGRQCLGLSDRTDQILVIRQMLIERGVPEEEIGMYVGAYKTGEFKLTGTITFSDKEGNVIKKHLRGLPPFKNREAAARYIREVKKEVGHQVIHEKTKIDHWWHKPDTADYEKIENESRIVLATYGIFDTGIDIKRLDWGIELTPRGDVAQAVGRVLREMSGKLMPEWYSIYDILWTTVSQQIMGETVTRKYNYTAPSRLEKRRRNSYHKQNAILIGVDNVAEAIEASRKAYREARQAGRHSFSQGRQDQACSGKADRTPERQGRLRLRKRAA